MGLDIIARALAGSARADAATALARSVPIGRFTELPTISVDASYSAVVTSGYSQAGSGAGRYVADALATPALAAAHPRACKASANGRYFRLLPDDAGAIRVEAMRDGADSDDTAANLAAGRYAHAIGCKRVAHSPRLWTINANKDYATGYPGTDGDYTTYPPGIYAVPNGATFKAAGTSPAGGGNRGYDYRGMFLDSGAAGVVTSAIAAGDTAIHVTTASAFATGEWVLFRFGDVPADPPETYNHGLARVTSVDSVGGTVTLDRAMPRPFTSGELSVAVNNKSVRRIAPMIGIDFGDIVFDDSVTDALSGVVLKYSEGCRFGTVGGRNIGAGSFIAQFAYNWHVEKIYNFNCPSTSADTGNIARFSEARGTVGSIVSHDCDGTIVVEAASIVKIGYVEDDNRKGARTLFQMNGRSHIDVERVTLLGLGGQTLVDPQDNSQFTAKHVQVRTSAMPAYLGKMGKHISETLTLEIAGAVPEVYRTAEGYWIEKRVQLRNGMADTLIVAPANTLLVESRIYASSGVTAGLNWLNVGRQGGAANTLASSIVPGSWRASSNWSVCDAFNLGRNLPIFLYVDTAAAGGAVPDLSGQFLICRFRVIPETSGADVAVTSSDALSAANQHFGSATWDPPSVASGARTSTTVSVAGCHVGDFVEATFANDLQGMLLSAQVLSDNNVTVTLTNPTGAAINLASGTVRARVRR